jgi:hypothetical protein
MSKQEQEVKRLLTALRREASEGLTANAIRRQALAAHKGTAESEILAAEGHRVVFGGSSLG